MKILAIDSSGMTASVAVACEEKVIAVYTIEYKKTHSQTLVPMMDQIRKDIELDLTQLDAIAVAGGPGSFTGLRIGSATAKGLGLALDKPIVNVPTLEGMAWNFYGSQGLICPMIDARRGQVYTGIYQFEEKEDSVFGGIIRVIENQMAVSVEDAADKLNAYRKPVILLGDGCDVYKERLKERLHVPYLFAPPHLNHQNAASVACCALQYLREGRTQTAMEHKPDYLRVSQAERERAEKMKNGTQTGSSQSDDAEN